MAFEIDGSAPPDGAKPIGNGYNLVFPESTGNRGTGEPCGAAGLPRLELSWDAMGQTGWNWWAAKTLEALSAAISSIQLWNDYKSGGAGWETWTGGGILHQAKYESIRWGNYYGVTVIITNLEKS